MAAAGLKSGGMIVVTRKKATPRSAAESFAVLSEQAAEGLAARSEAGAVLPGDGEAGAPAPVWVGEDGGEDSPTRSSSRARSALLASSSTAELLDKLLHGDSPGKAAAGAGAGAAESAALAPAKARESRSGSSGPVSATGGMPTLPAPAALPSITSPVSSVDRRHGFSILGSMLSVVAAGSVVSAWQAEVEALVRQEELIAEDAAEEGKAGKGGKGKGAKGGAAKGKGGKAKTGLPGSPEQSRPAAPAQTPSPPAPHVMSEEEVAALAASLARQEREKADAEASAAAASLAASIEAAQAALEEEANAAQEEWQPGGGRTAKAKGSAPAAPAPAPAKVAAAKAPAAAPAPAKVVARAAGGSGRGCGQSKGRPCCGARQGTGRGCCRKAGRSDESADAGEGFCALAYQGRGVRAREWHTIDRGSNPGTRACPRSSTRRGGSAPAAPDAAPRHPARTRTCPLRPCLLL